MKKLLILFMSLVIVLPSIVYGEIKADKLSCSDKGVLNFKVVYTCTADQCVDEPRKPIMNIIITAESVGKKYNLSGEFYKDGSIYEASTLLQGISYEFASRNDILDPKQKYNIIVGDGEKNNTYSLECPDFKYRCNKINLKIETCGKQEKYAYLIFSGLNQEFAQAELRKDIDYYINPTTEFTYPYRKRGLAEEMPSSFEVSAIGFDHYLFKVPILDLKNRKTDDFFIQIKDCNEDMYNVSAYKLCREEQCYEDKDCPIGTYCGLEKKKCKLLECSSCEKISSHKCISACKPKNTCEEASCDDGVCTYTPIENCCEKESDCDDALVCTTDKCDNNKCSHIQKECPASADPCVIGTCKEPDGCKYGLNPECYNQTEEQKETKVTGAAVTETKKEASPSLIQRIVNWLKGIFS